MLGAVVLADLASFVSYEEGQATGGVPQVRHTCLWIGFLTAPPRPHMTLKSREAARPGEALLPVALAVFLGTEGKDAGGADEELGRQEIEAILVGIELRGWPIIV